MDQEKIIVLDFGGQYKQLIARRVREQNVYCEIHPSGIGLEKLKELSPKGVILTGGPNSVYAPESPSFDPGIFNLGVPVLGICYGSQLMAYLLGGEVKTAPVSEYGHTDVVYDKSDSVLFKDNASTGIAWMSHTDYIAKAPEGFEVSAHTVNCPVAAMENSERKLYAVQFHPEVEHTVNGADMIRHFVIDVCGCSGSWKMASFAEETIKELREKIGSDRVLLGLSGGVDSTVTAVLLSKAIGKQLYCVFVDHGLMRKNEGDEVEAVFGPGGKFGDLNFIRVNAGPEYFEMLKGVSDPEKKRKLIGNKFVEIFGNEARRLAGSGGFKYMAQGTIYPDVVESGMGKDGAVIKSHHNVGGLPHDLVVELGFDENPVEPLRSLFKDEVRKAGLELGIPRELVYRQPFPGPGLGIRVVGEVTPEKVAIVQEADAIYREELMRAGIDTGKGQFFAALSDMRSVGVMGDFRTYDYALVLRGVITSDFMTAEAAEIPWSVLQTCMNRIINEVKGVNRVLYDLTSKPPGTIELE